MLQGRHKYLLQCKNLKRTPIEVNYAKALTMDNVKFSELLGSEGACEKIEDPSLVSKTETGFMAPSAILVDESINKVSDDMKRALLGYNDRVRCTTVANEKKNALLGLEKQQFEYADDLDPKQLVPFLTPIAQYMQLYFRNLRNNIPTQVQNFFTYCNLWMCMSVINDNDFRVVPSEHTRERSEFLIGRIASAFGNRAAYLQ